MDERRASGSLCSTLRFARQTGLFCYGTIGISVVLLAGVNSPTVRADSPAIARGRLRAAVTKSLELIEKSTAEYREQRSCFSCHHQAVPTLAFSEARRRGFPIDADNLQQQIEHTAAHLQRGRKRYREGRGQGGKADTAGYALWTLQAGGRKPDKTIATVVEYLLQWQKDLGHWRCTSDRPPSETSDFTTTYLALRGLDAFGSSEHEERIAGRKDQARQWLITTDPEDTEDRVFRLRALSHLGADAEAQQSAQELIARQREDGGWAQTAGMDSDAYATGTALVALHRAGDLAVTGSVYQRGVRFLLDTQLSDGSWYVTSRSEPFQTYFESGFPHGQDQFISIAASSWATLALLYACP